MLRHPNAPLEDDGIEQRENTEARIREAQAALARLEELDATSPQVRSGGKTSHTFTPCGRAAS